LWSIATGVTQSIFDAGKLKAGQKAAEARYQQGVAEYAKTILSAFAEVEGAFLTREEQLKGAIEVGKLADLTVLDRDYFSIPDREIKDVQTVMTTVGGKIVYERGRKQ